MHTGEHSTYQGVRIVSHIPRKVWQKQGGKEKQREKRGKYRKRQDKEEEKLKQIKGNN